MSAASSEAPAAGPVRRKIPFLPNIFYGWWILIAGTSIMTVVGTTNTYGLSLFFIPLITQFGWSRAALSGALSLARLESGLIGPLEGFLVDRFGPRKMMLLGVPLIAVGFYLLSRLEDITAFTGWDALILFYTIYVLGITLGSSLGTSMAASTAVANWFIRRRGTALGILSAGVGIGAGLWVPVIGMVLARTSWEQASVFAAFLVLIVGIPAAFVMRHRPEDYGYLPDGETAPAEDATAANSERTQARPRVVEEEFTVRQALSTPAFWVLAFSFAMRVMVTSAVTLHLVPLLSDMGRSPLEAAFALSAQAILSIIGRIGLGYIGDRFDKKVVYTAALLVLLVGVLVLAFATEVWQVGIFLVLYAPAYGGAAALMSALRGDYFGRRAFATIAGAMTPINTLGTISGPLFAGLVYDNTGSYQIAMFTFAAIVAVNLVLLQMLRRPHLKPGDA